MMQRATRRKCGWFGACTMLGVTLALCGTLLLCSAGNVEAAKESSDLRVAAIFETPIEEPWVKQIHDALIKARDKLGIEYTWSESVKPADFSRVMREYAEGGYDLIMGDAFAAETTARRVARDYPDTAFVFGSGLAPAEPNFSVFDNWIHEPAYLCGIIAGKMTESDIIGIVGGRPVPEVNRITNAFINGAKEVNPDVRVKVAFIGSWFDPPKAKETALAQIEAGADVLYAERFGVIEACVERDVLAISNMSDQHDLGPDHVITGPVWDMWPTVKHVINVVEAGVYTAQDFGQFSYMSKGGSYLAPYHKWEEKLPEDVKQMVEKRKQEILDGTFRVPVEESQPKSD